MARYDIVNTVVVEPSAVPPTTRTHIRRLIETDLPIKRISAHASREKSVRHGHISTLHVWWARRPLAACRAVICAALWPDPADPNCPPAFRDAAARIITEFANKVVGKGKIDGQSLLETCSPESLGRWEGIVTSGIPLDPIDEAHQNVLRFALLDFIADFTNWDNSTVPAYLGTARALTQAAHEALGGKPGSRALVLDPFAGGGSIPMEALRVGADAWASDLNPIPVLLNKVLLEYIPKYGEQLATEFRRAAARVQEIAKAKTAPLFPGLDDPAPPVAFLWARTIVCEGPGCGTEVPLIRSPWLSKQGKRRVAIELIPNPTRKHIDIAIIENASAKVQRQGTVRRGSVTCPCCGYTTAVASVRKQLHARSGGADSSRMLAVVLRSPEGKSYRLPDAADLEAVRKVLESVDRSSILPPIELPLMSGVFNAPIYGIVRWDLLFSARQLLVAKILSDAIQTSLEELRTRNDDLQLMLAIKVLLVLARGKYLDFRSTLCAWISVGEKIGHTFGRQALGMIFDWTEGVPFGDISGSWERSFGYIAEFIDHERSSFTYQGHSERALSQAHLLPDDCVDAFVTDPPYYNAVPYADLSDFFYIWLRKDLCSDFPGLFDERTVPKADELCEMKGWDPVRYNEKDSVFYETGMQAAFAEGRRVCRPSGIGVVVFAHKSTTGWETLLSALIKSGWVVTGSWPLDTERRGRLRAMGSAALGSSVHLVCRPRQDADCAVAEVAIGDWRDVLAELPKRIHDWMPRLAQEGVVGADAIFACIGPALEIFSRFDIVEKASGEVVPLREYLEHVWAAVAHEAIAMIFQDADAASLEPDARLTAMWLWTVGVGQSPTNGPNTPIVVKAGVAAVGVSVRSAIAGDDEVHNAMDADTNGEGDDESVASKRPKADGSVLEFDEANRIAQGLGVSLEKIESVVEVKGDKARLLPVAERTRYLFGKDKGDGMKAPSRGKAKKVKQKHFFEELGDVEAADPGWAALKGPSPGATALDRLHQSMILFGAGRGELMKRFLVDEGVGSDARFWKLAQSLSALYPGGSDEKRWVDGVLARKKGLGF